MEDFEALVNSLWDKTEAAREATDRGLQAKPDGEALQQLADILEQHPDLFTASDDPNDELYTRGMQWRASKEARRHFMQAQAIEQESRPCTGKPALSKKSKETIKKLQQDGSWPPLVDRLLTYQNVKEEKRAKTQKWKEMHEVLADTSSYAPQITAKAAALNRQGMTTTRLYESRDDVKKKLESRSYPHGTPNPNWTDEQLSAYIIDNPKEKEHATKCVKGTSASSQSRQLSERLVQRTGISHWDRLNGCSPSAADILAVSPIQRSPTSPSKRVPVIGKHSTQLAKARRERKDLNKVFWERLSRPNPPPIQPPPLKGIPVIGNPPVDPSNGEILSERAMKPVYDRLYADHEEHQHHKESLLRQSNAQIKEASNRGSGKLKSSSTPMDVFNRNKKWEDNVKEKKRIARMKAIDDEVNHPFRPSLTPYSKGGGRSPSPLPTPPTVPHFEGGDAPTMTLADLQQLILSDSSVASDDLEGLQTPTNALSPQTTSTSKTITFSETQMKLLAAAKPVAVTTPNSSDVDDLHTPSRNWPLEEDLDPPHSESDSPRSPITFKEMQELLMSSSSVPNQPPATAEAKKREKSPTRSVVLSEKQKLLLAGATPASIANHPPEPIITFAEMQDIISGERGDSLPSDNVDDTFREMHAMLGGDDNNTPRVASPRSWEDQCSPQTILSESNKFEFTDLEKDAPQQVNKLSGWGAESSPAKEATRVVSKILNELEAQHGQTNPQKLRFENISGPSKEVKPPCKKEETRCQSPEDFDADYFESNSPIRSMSRTSTSGGGMRSAPPLQYPSVYRSPTPQEYLNAALAGGHAAETHPIPGHVVTPLGSRDLPVTPMRSIGGEGPLVYSQQVSPFVKSLNNLNTPGSSRGMRHQTNQTTTRPSQGQGYNNHNKSYSTKSNPPREPQGRSVSPRRSTSNRSGLSRSPSRGSPRHPVGSVKSKPGGGYSSVRGSPAATTQSYRGGTPGSVHRGRQAPRPSHQPTPSTPEEVPLTKPITNRSPSPYNRRVQSGESVNECFVAPDGEVRLLRMGKQQIKAVSESAISRSQRMLDHNTSNSRFEKARQGGPEVKQRQIVPLTHKSGQETLIDRYGDMVVPNNNGEDSEERLANVILSASQSPPPQRGSIGGGGKKQPQVKVSQLVRLKPKTAMELDFVETSDTENDEKLGDSIVGNIPTERGAISGVILQRDSDFDSMNEVDKEQEATERAGSLTRHHLAPYLSTSLSLATAGVPPSAKHDVINPEWDSATAPTSDINLVSLLDSPLKKFRRPYREGKAFMMTGSPPRS